MALFITGQNLSLAFGWRPLLKEVNFSLETGDKIALLGRNGEGKSTLLNVLRQHQTPDDGELKLATGVKVAYLPQDPPSADDRLVREVVGESLAHLKSALDEYQTLITDPSASSERLHELEHRLHQENGWQMDDRIDQVLQRFELDGNQKMADLSGGWRRRVWLARVWVSNPDVLLLDEPTNHLDINAIIWLEQLLLNFNGAVVFVTHDRAFMEKVANRIWHLDRGRLLDVRDTYQRFLRTREEALHAETLENSRFDKKLAEEEVWIRQGIKARRTRNEGRVRALKAMRQEYQQRVAQQGKVTFRLDEGNRSGKQVIVADNLAFSYQNADNHLPIQGFSDIIERGEVIGLVGANGAGKTTLLHLLLGKIQPNSGTIKHGTNLSVAYFDQLRSALNGEETLRDSVGLGSEFVEIAGVKKHIASYLQDFLFPPERWNTPVSALSGGERARLLLARLFAQPANLLVLDEPTNDLDVETLELLAEVLSEYSGTVLIVSHDRAFLDEVVSRLYVFNRQKNKIEIIAGGFADWLQQGGDVAQLLPKTVQKEALPKKNPEPVKTPEKNKLSYKYQRELEALPDKINQAETELARLTQMIEHPDFYQKENSEQQKIFAQLQSAQEALDGLMNRWLELEEGHA